MFLLIESVAIKLGAFQGGSSLHFVTRLPVLDNWVLGFSSIRWMSLLLFATSESKPRVQLFLCKIVGRCRGETYTFLYVIYLDFITIAFETQ